MSLLGLITYCEKLAVVATALLKMDLIEGTYDCIRDQKHVDFLIQMGKHFFLMPICNASKGAW